MSSSMEKERCNNGDSNEKGLKKGPWSKEEDEILIAYMTKKEKSNWNSVSKNSGLSRCFRSCRLRWNNHLDKRVKKGPFSEEEARIVFELRTGGLKWSEIARKIPGRTDHAIKNHWYGKERKRKRKLEKLGLSPDSQHIKHDDVLNKNNREQLPTLFDVPDKQLPKLVDDSNMSYNDVGGTSISNHTAPTSIDMGDNGTNSHTPMTMVSDLPPLPQCSYILSPKETQYHHMLQSKSLESILDAHKCLEGSDATRMGPSEIILVNERGKKPISEENYYVEINHGDLMDNDGLLKSILKTLESGEGSHARPSGIDLVDEIGKKSIYPENDVEANHDDLMSTDLLFDYDSYDNDNNNCMTSIHTI